MLRRLSANHSEFIPIEFTDGFNIIVADRAPGASDLHSRNARGKTTTINVINYCLGSNRPSTLANLLESDWEFSLTLDLFGDSITVSRHLKRGGRVRVESTSDAYGVWDEYRSDDGTVSIADWKFLLGLALFGLDETNEGTTHGLSARTLLSYVIRVDAPKDPTKVVTQQPAWSSRQHVAYMLGLDWHFTHTLSAMDREESTYAAIQYASESRLLPSVISSEPDILIERTEAQAEYSALRARIGDFIVLDDPTGVVEEADRVNEEIRELRNDEAVESRLLSLYVESMDDSDPIASDNVPLVELYEEIGRTFSSSALRRLEEVSVFHGVVMNNRRRFLGAEVDRLRTLQQQRQARLTELGQRRNTLVNQMNSGGAVDELLTLQARLSEAEARVKEVDRSLSAVRQVSAAQEELRVRRARTRQNARLELEARRNRLDRVASRFDSMMRELYGRSGVLTVEVDDLGYKFAIKVPGSASSGVARMQLLCFDLTLMAEAGDVRHPDFLIHDSSVFDGVDPRQTAAALRLVNRTVRAANGQYLVTMNSNDVPESVLGEKWYQDGVRRTILDTEEGGVMGVDF